MKQFRRANIEPTWIVLGSDGFYARVAAIVGTGGRSGVVAQRTAGRGVFVPLIFSSGDAFQFDWSED